MNKLMVPIWGVLVIVISSYFYIYQFTDGHFIIKEDYKKALSLLDKQSQQEYPLTLLFLHPECPCSDASIYEITQMQKLNSEMNFKIIISYPKNTYNKWVSSNRAKRQLLKNKSIELIDDKNNVLSDAFGASTSGVTLIFKEENNLVFAGGITPSRGHLGRTIAHEIIKEASLFSFTKNEVYGCSINTQENCTEDKICNIH